ncbi:MAG: hypothetical protein RUMPE_01244 [Eubacteriales bacterium SKADARSKE-1]|nr:hypothetical protein [Eubacteriales bacterium SKADARSKE-1]
MKIFGYIEELLLIVSIGIIFILKTIKTFKPNKLKSINTEQNLDFLLILFICSLVTTAILSYFFKLPSFAKGFIICALTTFGLDSFFRLLKVNKRFIQIICTLLLTGLNVYMASNDMFI